MFNNTYRVLTYGFHTYYLTLKELATLAGLFESFNKIKLLKQIIFPLLLFISIGAKAQKIDSIYVNLYTDSLKKGTYNYINIDGKLANGKYLPLDSSHIIFETSDGKFYGNSLWLDPGFSKEKVTIKAILRTNNSICKKFVVYIKKNEDPKILKTVDELLKEKKISKKKKAG